MRWNCMSKALRLAQITVEHQDCQFFTVFLTRKTSSQNISITLVQISLKLQEDRGDYCSKTLPRTILKEQFPAPRNTAASRSGNGIISLLWQLPCHCNPDHNKVSSLSNTTVVSIFPNLCLWRRSLRSNFRGIDLEKLYRATLNTLLTSNERTMNGTPIIVITGMRLFWFLICMKDTGVWFLNKNWRSSLKVWQSGVKKRTKRRIELGEFSLPIACRGFIRTRC